MSFEEWWEENYETYCFGTFGTLNYVAIKEIAERAWDESKEQHDASN